MGQAAEQGHPLSTEIKVLILHGLLHLAGYDHEADDGKMARRERLLRGRLGLPQGLIERAVAGEVPGKHPSGAKARSDSGESGARDKSLAYRKNPWPTARTRTSSGAKARADSVAADVRAEARTLRSEKAKRP
jgi:hypothetical protein